MPLVRSILLVIAVAAVFGAAAQLVRGERRSTSKPNGQFISMDFSMPIHKGRSREPTTRFLKQWHANDAAVDLIVG
jgi:hypothetical protein